MVSQAAKVHGMEAKVRIGSVVTVTNTPSFDIPNNSISTTTNIPCSPNPGVTAGGSQLAYNPAQSTIQNRANMYAINPANGVDVSAQSNLGAVEQTIGSPRILQTSMRLRF